MSLFYKHTKYGVIKVSALIKEGELRSLNDFLLKEFDELSYGGRTKDGTSVKFDDVNELLAFPNFSTRRLIELNISASKKDKSSININFIKEREFIAPESINYYLSYNDQNWGFKFEDDLKNELKSFVPYYNLLTYLNYTFGLPILIFICFTLFMVLDYFLKELGFSGFTDTDYYTESEDSPSSFVGYAWIVLVVGMTYLISLIRNYLFPVLYIATGKQEREYKKRKTISYFLFGVILLGIVINLISALLVKGVTS